MLGGVGIIDVDMLLLLEKKYKIEIDEFGQEENKNISIFKNWIWLFSSLSELEKLYQQGKKIEECDFLEGSPNSEKTRGLFLNLLDINEEIFAYKHRIEFDLFAIYKQSLEVYDQQISRFQKNRFIQVLRNYVLARGEFPIAACLDFYSIFTRQLDFSKKIVGRSTRNQQQLNHSYQEVHSLYKRYGDLYTLNVMYQFKLSQNLCSQDPKKWFHELRLIEQQIVSDERLLKVLFKLEDDGQHGCFLNCILIYPAQALSNIDRCLYQLEQLAYECTNGAQIEFLNWGGVLNYTSGKDVFGFINDFEKLENFLYWAVGSFYKHEDFFSYSTALYEPNSEEFQHEQVLNPWTLSITPTRVGMHKNFTHISQSELISYISDPKEVWSIEVLPAAFQNELDVDKILLSELPYDLEQFENLNTEILYCLQVFHMFLKVGNEPFFYLDKFNDLITSVQPSRLGRQLIYLFNLLCQQQDAIQQVKGQISLLGQRFQLLLDNQVWLALEKISEKGSAAITDVKILQQFNLLRVHYQPDQLSARMSEFDTSDVDLVFFSKDDFVAYKRRTIHAQQYLEGLLSYNQLICRFKFYAEVGGESFLEKREIFSAHFTEFLRIHKRSDLLKELNGYFLIWSNKPLHRSFVKQKIEPYVDIVFLVEPSYGFSISSFEQKLVMAWNDFQGKKSLLAKHEKYIRTRSLCLEVLMSSEELLASKFVTFEKKNKKLKKALLEKLVPYFTYRHFYLPKLYDVREHKKVKMFSKGSSK